MSGFIALENRGMAVISGADRVAFLQGLVTQDVTQAGPPAYSAMLTPQGKFLFDFFLRAEGEAIHLECQRDRTPDLIRRLGLYRLRSQVDLADASAGHAVLFLLPGLAVPPLKAATVFSDPRRPGLGWRVHVAADWLPDAKAALLGAGYPELQDDDYLHHRLRHGVGEGADIPAERGIPLEYNLDALNAISWTKGCYVGQELTARTRYRGLIRKRLLPLVGEAPLPATGAVMREGQEIGELRIVLGTYALAMLRLEHIGTAEGLTVAGIPVKLYWPEWLDKAMLGPQ